MKESKFQIQSQTFRTMKSIEERKGKNEKKKKKLFPSQLIRLIARLRRIDPELANLEKVDFLWNKS